MGVGTANARIRFSQRHSPIPTLTLEGGGRARGVPPGASAARLRGVAGEHDRRMLPVYCE
jgi:hypothetical protein